jgi:long-chain-fatty-acid--CoA ligase ACSBG
MGIDVTIMGIIILMILVIGIYFYTKKTNIENILCSQITNELFENEKYKKFTIIDFLKHIAKQYPKYCALKIKNGKNGWKEVSYFSYYKNIMNFSYSLNYWLGPKANVAIIGSNSPGWFYAHLGCMLNGGTSVGLYPTNTTDMCVHIINNSNAELLVVDDDEQLKKFVDTAIPTIKLIIYYSPVKNKTVEKFNIPVISMGNFMAQQNKTNSISKPKINDIATLIYTSDNLKGAELTHENIMTSLRQMIGLINTKSTIKQLGEEQFVSYLPLNHIATQIMDIYIPIVTLGTVWFAGKDALKDSSLIDTIVDVRPTVFIGIPHVWEKMQEKIDEEVSKSGIKGSLAKTFSPWKILEKLGLNRCKLAFTSTAPILQSTKNYFNSIDLNLYEIYGMSETAGPISISLPGLNRIGSVGAPIMNVKISKDNEIMVKGKNLFKGYRSIKSTDKSFTKDGWFLTGDLGKLDADGFLYITGRKKETIITAEGEIISPIQIETKLKEYLGKYFEYIIVVGDKKKFLSVLLVPIVNRKLPDNINEIITNSINEINKTVQHTIKKWDILKNKFKVGEEITPTLKVRRTFINDKYKKQISKMYK